MPAVTKRRDHHVPAWDQPAVGSFKISPEEVAQIVGAPNPEKALIAAYRASQPLRNR